jgi:tetratricopeptide (TPR) repeat protein
VSTESLELAKTQYNAGKQAFERGEYRQSVGYLEKAVSLANPNSQLGGEIQTWLITAYQAAGQQTEAIELCEKLATHPDLKIRQQSNRLIYILKAPQLKTRPEWLTQIPDLTSLGEASDKQSTLRGPSAPKPTKPKSLPEPVDLSQVNTKDNRFVWVAFGAIVLIAGVLFWLNQSS